MRQLMYLYYDDWWTPKKGEYPLPCQTIENLSYEYTENSGHDARNQSRFMVLVHYPNLKYRQIAHVQEYDVENLFGNIGGYIGLFLGYSLINFPRFVISSFDIIRKKLLPGLNRKRRNTVYRKPIMMPGAALDISESHIASRITQYRNLNDMKNEMIGMVRNIEDLEAQVECPDNGLHIENSASSDRSWKKVQISAWSTAMPKLPVHVK